MTDQISDRSSPQQPRGEESQLNFGLIALAMESSLENAKATQQDSAKEVPTATRTEDSPGSAGGSPASYDALPATTPEIDVPKVIPNPEDVLPPETPFAPIEPIRRPIVLTDKDFDQLGDALAKTMRDAGVQNIQIDVGTNSDRVTVGLKKPLDITPDPPSANLNKIQIEKTLQTDIHRTKDGSIYIENIRGLSAIVNVLGAWQSVPITRVIMTPTADGKTQITVTGQVGLFNQTQTSTKPGDLIKKADDLVDKLGELKKKKVAPDETN